MECDTTSASVEFSHLTGWFLNTCTHRHTHTSSHRGYSIIPIVGSFPFFFFQSWLLLKNTYIQPTKSTVQHHPGGNQAYRQNVGYARLCLPFILTLCCSKYISSFLLKPLQFVLVTDRLKNGFSESQIHRHIFIPSIWRQVPRLRIL